MEKPPNLKNRIQSVLSQRFTSDVIWNFGSLGFLALGGLLMNGVIFKFRGPGALGVFNQVYALYIVLSQIGVGGIQHSVLRHISYNQEDLDLCADSTSAAILLILGITIPLGLIGYILAGPISQLFDSPGVYRGLQVVIPGIIFFSINKVLINVLNGLRRMRVYAVFRSLRFVLITTFIISLIVLGSDTDLLPLSLTLTELVLFLVLISYTSTTVMRFRFPKHLGSLMKMHLSYGVRGVMSGVLLELNTRIDVLMLGIFLSDYWVGVYSFAAILAEGFAQLPMAVRYNVDPLLGDYFSSNQLDQIPDLKQRIRKLFIPVMTILGILSVLAFPFLYRLMAGNDGLVQSWIVYSIFALVHTATAAYSPFRGLLLQGNKPGLYTIIIISSTILNIILNIILIGPLNVYGAAIGSGSSIILEYLLINSLSRKTVRAHS